MSAMVLCESHGKREKEVLNRILHYTIELLPKRYAREIALRHVRARIMPTVDGGANGG